jgi:hypothetical protein
MKKIFIVISLTLLAGKSYEQILLEDKKGDQIANNSPIYTNKAGLSGINVALIKLNTGDQSLGFNYITTTKSINPSNYKIHEFGVKAKSTEGFASVFNNWQFSPGLRFDYSLTKVHIFKDVTDYIDWGGITLSYDINKYSLYKKDTTFSNQFYSQNFKGLNIAFNYNALVKNSWIVNVKAGYSRSNNYDDLVAIDVQDISSITDPATSTVRQVIRKRSAKEGNFSEFDAYPITIALIKATPTDVSGAPYATKLRFGYTIYLKNIASNIDIPNTTVGAVFFLTEQAKNGVRSPVFGLNIQAADPFDIHHLNTGLSNRIGVGFTTIFSL